MCISPAVLSDNKISVKPFGERTHRSRMRHRWFAVQTCRIMNRIVWDLGVQSLPGSRSVNPAKIEDCCCVIPGKYWSALPRRKVVTLQVYPRSSAVPIYSGLIGLWMQSIVCLISINFTRAEWRYARHNLNSLKACRSNPCRGCWQIGCRMRSAKKAERWPLSVPGKECVIVCVIVRNNYH